MPRVVEAERSHGAPSPSDPTRRVGRRSRVLPTTRTIAALLRLLAVGGAVVLATAAAAATAAEPNAAGSAGWFSTSPVPGARQGELTLVPHPDSQRYLTFTTQTPIEGHLRTADPLSSPGLPIALRLFRSDPAEGLLMTWSDLFKVNADQTALDFEIAGQEPGTYRLLAYHALTEPLAVLDLAIVGETSALPAPPPVPEGWQTVSSMSGDLVLRLPPDFGAVADWSSIVANPPPDGEGAWIDRPRREPRRRRSSAVARHLAGRLAGRALVRGRQRRVVATGDDGHPAAGRRGGQAHQDTASMAVRSARPCTRSAPLMEWDSSSSTDPLT